jgi:hypothetical protein
MEFRNTGLVILLILFSCAAVSQPIQLKGNSFTPTESTPQVQSFGVQGHTDDYMLLQFRESTKKEYREEISEKGVEFISYIPENAWLVKLDGKKNEVISEKKVRYLGPYRAKYKISPELRSEMQESSGEVRIRVEMFENDESVLSEHGTIDGKFGHDTWKLETDYSKISEIAEEKQVKWISPKAPEKSTMNDGSRDLIEVDQLQDSPYNLSGDGFTASIWDAGWAGDHSDLNYTDSKLTVGDRGENCGPTYEPSNCQVKSHPTHVAGTMLGAGVNQNSYRGMAPNASLVTYEWPGNDTGVTDEEETENELDESINSYSSILSQNSWGYQSDTIAGYYGYLADVYDSAASGDNSRVNGEPLTVFSAGNFRNNVPRDYNTTMPPSTGKNVITVGAVYEDKSTVVFSSWGPTDDGRIKPTLVANGVNIYSTVPGDSYGYKSGTSMAAPAVSGAAILLNEKYNDTYSELPSPATTKGVLVHTAEDLNRTGPDYITGWGLVNATAAANYVNESEGRGILQTGDVDTGESDNWTVSVPENEALNFTLVWSDYPASSGAAEALVNDLDLVVENSSGHRFYPWTLNWSIRDQQAVRTKKDERNVVEQVYVPDTSSQELTIKVNGTNIPKGPQDYSLMLDPQVQVVPNLTIDSPLNQSYGEVPDFNLSSSDNLSDAKFSLNGNGNYSMVEKNSSYFYNTSVSVEDGSYETVFWANDTEGDWNSEKVAFTVDRATPNLTVRNPEKNENISGEFWVNATWSSATDIETRSYEISNASVVKSGQLNASVNSSELADGGYNITYNITDEAGNFKSTNIEVRIDNSAPSLESFDPEDGDYFDSNFSVNATWSDSITGVKTADYSLENNSVQASGALNDTIDVSGLESGEYNLTYILRDHAGNYGNNTVEISVDREMPSLEILSPGNSSFVSGNFSVEASYYDNLSGMRWANYSVTNGSEQLSGNLNDTVDTSGLSEGEYNVSFNVSDNLGNFNSDYVNVTLDRTSPELNLTSPSGTVSGNFSVNATYSDLNRVDSANYTLENSSLQASGALNDTLNSSNFADGAYTVKANVSDLAGNLNTSSSSIEIDNSAPEILSSPVEENGNLSGVFDFNVTFDEASSVENSSFRVYNSSGNQTPWRELNYTGFNTSEFSDGDYTFSVEANDTLGNSGVNNFTGVTLDSTEPEISLVEYNDTMIDGWAKDEKTVEVQCSDSGSKVDEVSVGDSSNSSTPANFTLTDSGRENYTFSCTDFAGNSESVEKEFRIDSDDPELQDVSPDEDLETDRSFDLVGQIHDESSESGIDEEASFLSITEGSLENLEWENDSFTAEVSGLDYSQPFDISGEIEDNVGHTYEVSLSYTVKAEETNNGGGGGGGGGAPAATQDMQIEEESEGGNQTEASNTTTAEDEEEDGSNQCTGGAAVDQDGNSCRSFSGCKPDGWESVESCSVWEEKQEAQEILENVSETEADEELLQRAQQEFEKGNYSGARRLASQAQESSSSRIQEGFLLPIIALLLLVLGAAGFFGYRKYQERRLEEEIRDISDQILERVDDGEIAQEKPFVDSIIQAYQAIDMGKREKAERKLEKFYREIEAEGLDISRTSQ